MAELVDHHVLLTVSMVLVIVVYSVRYACE